MTNTTKHTPGPWWKSSAGFVRDDKDKAVASIYGKNGSCKHTCKVMEANTSLIAAAPELLEVVAQLVERGIADKSTMDKARAAIAKATGAS